MYRHDVRWQSRRTCTHLLLWGLKNCNKPLKNRWQENAESHSKKKKKIHHIQGQRRSHNKMVGGVKSCLESKLRPPEMLRGFKQNLVWTRTRGTHKRLSQICLWVFECLLQWHGSTVACHGNRGSGCSRPRRQSMWASPEGHRADNPQIGEQLNQRSSRTVAKVLGPTTDFPAWSIQQRDWKAPGSLTLKYSGIWLQNFHMTGETDS